MKNFLFSLFTFFAPLQEFFLFLSYFFFRNIFLKKKKNMVIGVHEISLNIFNLSKLFENSVSVNLNPNKFYNSEYDYSLNVANNYLRYFLNFFYGPFILGYLMNISNNFLYIWEKGFLLDRDKEFRFLKARNKKLILMFCGDDIRSPKLSFEYSNSKDVDNFLNYTTQDLQKQEIKVKLNARIADQYADVIFNFPICQISYLKKETFFFPYMYDSKNFNLLSNKFENINSFRIVHAPSNPLVKGTMLVRSAIKKLNILGYKIEYIELQNKSNSDVIDELKKSHIVLNSFYGLGYTIGQFGVEALANTNCLLTSFNSEKLEEDNLYSELDQICINTKYWEVFDKLKFLLDNPQEIKKIAIKGYHFAYNNFEYKNSKRHYDKILKDFS